MRTKSGLFILVSAFLLVCACGGGSRSGDMNKIFADMENGIRKEDEGLFKQHWHSEGYNRNLVGRSGLPGSKVFAQGSSKKWFLKPDFAKTVRQGNVEIFQCEVYAWEQSRTVDEIFLAVSTKDGKVLGGGEELSEVRGLADRFNEGKPLAPPE